MSPERLALIEERKELRTTYATIQKSIESMMKHVANNNSDKLQWRIRRAYFHLHRVANQLTTINYELQVLYVAETCSIIGPKAANKLRHAKLVHFEIAP